MGDKEIEELVEELGFQQMRRLGQVQERRQAPSPPLAPLGLQRSWQVPASWRHRKERRRRRPSKTASKYSTRASSLSRGSERTVGFDRCRNFQMCWPLHGNVNMFYQL